MTDFAKEARDLLERHWGGDHEAIHALIEEGLRRMYAEAMAKAAEIALAAGHLEKAEPDDWCSATEARCQIAVDIVADTRRQIAEAILAAAPPTLTNEEAPRAL